MGAITNGVKTPRSLPVIPLYVVLKKTEHRTSRQWRKFKVKSFPGATIQDMYDYIKPLLKKCSKIIWHIGTNNTVNETSRIALDKLLSLKKFVDKALPACNVCISNLTLRKDNVKALLTVNNVNRHLSILHCH